jgi:hypothetical protein
MTVLVSFCLKEKVQMAEDAGCAGMMRGSMRVGQWFQWSGKGFSRASVVL